MPLIAIENPEEFENFTRPVGMDIARSLFRLSGLDQETAISYPDEEGNNPNKLGVLNIPDDKTKTTQFRRMRVEISETFEADRQTTTPVNYADNRWIFTDVELGIYIKPVYMPTTIEVNCSYRAEDKVEAKRFQKYVLRKLCSGRRENLHEIKYHYPIPKRYLSILKEIHTLREARYGYGEDFETYMQSHFDPRVGAITGMAGKAINDVIVVYEGQIGLQGWFDFSDMPAIEKSDDGAAWDVNFTYLVTLDKPTATTFRYPLSVHQQPLSSRYVGTEGPYRLEERKGVAGRIRTANDGILKYFTSYNETMPWLKYPRYSEFSPNLPRTGAVPVVVAMLSLESTDPGVVVNLTEIKGCEFQPEVLAYMKKYAHKLRAWGYHAINVSLYQDDLRLDQSLISVDKDLNVSIDYELDGRKCYHLVISVYADLSGLQDDAAEELRREGPACLEIFKAIEPGIVNTKYYPTLIAGKYISLAQWVDVLDYIIKTHRYYKIPNDKHRFTVGLLTLVAHQELER